MTSPLFQPFALAAVSRLGGDGRCGLVDLDAGGGGRGTVPGLVRAAAGRRQVIAFAVSTVATSHVAMSESVSVPAKVTVTSVLFQPAAFAAGDGVAVTLGAVLSMLTPDTVAEALLPARSVTVKVVALARRLRR